MSTTTIRRSVKGERALSVAATNFSLPTSGVLTLPDSSTRNYTTTHSNSAGTQVAWGGTPLQVDVEIGATITFA